MLECRLRRVSHFYVHILCGERHHISREPLLKERLRTVDLLVLKEKRIVDTNAGKQLSSVATGV